MPKRLDQFVNEKRPEEAHRLVARPITGWALDALARIDREGGWGVLADLTTAGALSRQAAFVAAACLDLDNPNDFLARLHIEVPGAEGIGIALRSRRAREVIAAVFAVDAREVPTGYLRALERIDEGGLEDQGYSPLKASDAYRRLFDIFVQRPHSRAAHALRYCGALKSFSVEAVETLDPILLWPEVVRATSTPQQVSAANALLGLLRACVSTATDEEMVLTMRRSLGSKQCVDHFARRTLERADRLPAPPFPAGAGLRPLTSAADLEDFGKRMSNCAASKLAEIALGLLCIYEARHTTDDGREHVLAVSLSPLMNGAWTVSDLKGVKNRQPPATVRRAVLEQFRTLGALIPGPPLQSRYRSDLAQLLGAYRWGAIDDVLRDPNEADLDALDGLEDALSEVA